MYRIAICEDDKRYIDFLKKIIIDANMIEPEKILFFEFCSGEQFFLCQNIEFDLIILDIQMEKMDGYQIAMKIREADKRSLLVFCSGVEQPKPISFKVNPFRYLLKSFTDIEMLTEMQEILEEMIKRKEYPYILCKYRSGNEKIKVYADSILFISIKKNKCEVHTIGKINEYCLGESVIANMSLDDICEVFNEKCGFVRMHYSYTINMMYVIAVETQCVRLKDGTELNIARSKMKEFKQVYAKFLAAKYK